MADRNVIDGPETGPLVAGYWLWEVKNTADAVAWLKRRPHPMPAYSEIEVRPVARFEASPLAARLAP